MATAEELGFAKPVGTDLIRNGDNAISQNADKAAELIQDAWWDFTEREVLLSTADIYNLPPKLYRPISNTAAGNMGLPSSNYGTLEVLNAGDQGRTLVWHPISSDQRYYRNVRVGSTWQGWKEYRPVNPGSTGGVEREMRVAQANARRGGVYGTGGLAVLAMGFDHGTNNFMSKVLPILQEAAAPAMLGLNSQMYNPAYMFNSSDNSTTFAQLQDMAVNNGISVWNHGRLHNGGGAPEIIGGRDELSVSLPRIAIENWMHTGAYGDFNSGNSFADYWENEIGSTIMNGHAYLTGDIQEPIKQLSGQVTPGFDGEWIDAGASPLARVVTLVQEAQKRGGAVMTRMHPMYIDEDGYITTAQLRDFILWAAAERDAGRLLILTPDLVNIADAATSARRNLTDGIGGTGNQTRVISLSENALVLGSVNELQATVKLATAGSVRLTATATNLSASRTVTVPDNTWVNVRTFFTIPLSATGDLTVKAELVTGTGLTAHQLNVYPG